jgi:hypothetical protein
MRCSAVWLFAIRGQYTTGSKFHVLLPLALMAVAALFQKICALPLLGRNRWPAHPFVFSVAAEKEINTFGLRCDFSCRCMNVLQWGQVAMGTSPSR